MVFISRNKAWSRGCEGFRNTKRQPGAYGGVENSSG